MLQKKHVSTVGDLITFCRRGVVCSASDDVGLYNGDELCEDCLIARSS